MKTREEVDKLKQLWLDDKEAFDLTAVEGFEGHREELQAFVKEQSEEKDENPFKAFIPLFSNLAMTYLSGLSGKKGTHEFLDESATVIIKQRLKDIPENAPTQYFHDMGYDAYQNAYAIMQGRDQFMDELLLKKMTNSANK